MRTIHLKDYVAGDLPVGIWICRRAGDYAVHRHDCLELMLVTRGSGVCRVNGTPYPVLAGDVYFLGSGDVHSYEMSPCCTFYNLLFAPEFPANEPEVAEFLARRQREPGGRAVRFSLRDTGRMQQFADALKQELDSRRPGRQAMVRSLLNGFLIRLLRNGSAGDGMWEEGAEPQRFSALMEFINSNPERTLSGELLAKRAGMSVSRFRAAFRKWTGQSLRAYQEALRIDRARLLLEDPELPIGEIALRLGFYDNSHFTRSFLAGTGVSPRDYRRSCGARES